MRNEVLRMERVTYIEDEVVKLKDFNLQIYQGAGDGTSSCDQPWKIFSPEASGKKSAVV